MITLSSEQLERAQEILKHVPNGMPKAAARAINRAANSGRTAAVEKIKNEYTIKSGRISSSVEIRPKASVNNLSARIYTRGKPMALSYFETKPKNVPRKRPTIALYAKVKRSGGGTIKSAFLAKMNSGHIGVFVRSKTQLMARGRNIRKSGKWAGKKIGGKRYALIQEHGPSIPQMLDNPTVTEFIERKAYEVLNDRFEHEINYLLKGGR